MFGGLKSLFGGGNAQGLANMLGPMLPGMLKEAKPALLQTFTDKTLELENELAYELTDENEIAPFLVIREGELRIQWVVLTHQDDDIIFIEDVLEITSIDDLFNAATKQAVPPMELPEPAELNVPPGTLLQRAGVDNETHDQYFFQRFVVIKVGTIYEVIEGPAAEGDTVYYGHQDENICQNWADEQNRKLNL